MSTTEPTTTATGEQQMMTETNHRARINSVIQDEYPGAYSYTDAADCSSPDNPNSPGALWLARIVDDTAERMAWDLEHGEFDVESFLDEHTHEIADVMVPIYTHELWAVFVDLAAYNEDITEIGGDTTDMDQAARTALYLIARRLSDTVARHVSEALEL